jgi:hypothetical protein
MANLPSSFDYITCVVKKKSGIKCELCKSASNDVFLWEVYPGFEPTGCDHRMCSMCVEKDCVPKLVTGGVLTMEPVFNF